MTKECSQDCGKKSHCETVHRCRDSFMTRGAKNSDHCQQLHFLHDHGMHDIVPWDRRAIRDCSFCVARIYDIVHA